MCRYLWTVKLLNTDQQVLNKNSVKSAHYQCPSHVYSFVGLLKLKAKHYFINSEYTFICIETDSDMGVSARMRTCVRARGLNKTLICHDAPCLTFTKCIF